MTQNHECGMDEYCGRLDLECCSKHRERAMKSTLGIVSRWGESDDDRRDYEWLAEKPEGRA